MVKKFIIFCFIFVSFQALANENLLTFQQQLERLQREINDISKIIYNDKKDYEKLFDDSLSKNLSAIDIRIYDIENDLKNLTANLEEIFFTLDELNSKITFIQESINSNKNQTENINNVSEANINSYNEDVDVENDITNENGNTLGTLTISSNLEEEEIAANQINNDNNTENEETLKPEDQFQRAFDNIRFKKYNEAETSLKEFIKNNSENQLSGSAHYWLGELYILKGEYREAALTLAEGFQKYTESIKAPDMLFKLSTTLFELNKVNEACKTAQKYIAEFPNHKFVKKTNTLILDNKCLENNE